MSDATKHGVDLLPLEDRKTPEAWVREFAAERGMTLDDPRLFEAAWILAADNPRHPLVLWVAAQAEAKAGSEP